MDLSNDSIKPTDLYAGLTLTRLQAFVAVVDHGGFSAAAASLALGQSTVSFHVKALERASSMPTATLPIRMTPRSATARAA